MRTLAARLGLGCVLLASVALGQGTGEISLGAAWLRQSGSDDSFHSQYGLGSGLFLEGLRVDGRDLLRAGHERFELSLAGFGAEPWQKASLKVDWDHEWKLRLDYSRRETFFASPSFDLGVRRDDWAISRWTASLTYDGWNAVRLRLGAREVQRTGSETYAFYGLGLPYAGQNHIDERLHELGVGLETMRLPVKLMFEQDIARSQRRSRAAVANDGQPVGVTDPDILAVLTTPGEDRSTVPTTRAAAVFRNQRFEIVGQGTYRRERLTADRNDVTGYDFGGGAIGRLGFVDAVQGSADRNQSVGDVRLGVMLTPFVTVRVRGRYDDSSTDTSLVGERVLRLLGGDRPGEITMPVDDRGFIERVDSDLTGEVELRRGDFGLVVGYHDGSRQVKWERGSGDPSFTRDLGWWSAVASAALGKTFSAEVGWDDKSFSGFVFRADPEAVTRTWLRLSARPATGLELGAYLRRESADNPPEQASLDRAATFAGFSASFTAPTGAFLSASLDRLDLASDIDTTFYAPSVQSGTSHYDTNVLTASARGGVPLSGSVRLAGGATWVRDRGESLPFSSAGYDLRVEVDAGHDTGVALFANAWSYDLKRSDATDYDVARYGLSLRRRF